MTTFKDDYIVLVLPNNRGRLRKTCVSLGITWPPPEFIELAGGPISTPRYRCVRFSQITDEQRKTMTHVCRGAEYVHDSEGPPSKAPKKPTLRPL